MRDAAFAWVWLGQAPLTLVWTGTILALPDGEVGAGVRRGFLAAVSVLAVAIAVAGYLFAGPGQVPQFPPASASDQVAGPLSTRSRALSFPVTAAAFVVIGVGLDRQRCRDRT